MTTGSGIRFVEGNPFAGLTKVGDMRADLRANPGVWAEVGQCQTADRAEYSRLNGLKQSLHRRSSDLESHIRSAGGTSKLFARATK